MSKSASYGRIPSMFGHLSPRGGGMSRRSKSPSSTGSGKSVCLYSKKKTQKANVSLSFLVTQKSTCCVFCSISSLCFCWYLFGSVFAVLTANGTAGSQLSNPRSGKSPSPSPTSPASLRRRQVMKSKFLKTDS